MPGAARLQEPNTGGVGLPIAEGELAAGAPDLPLEGSLGAGAPAAVHAGVLLGLVLNIADRAERPLRAMSRPPRRQLSGDAPRNRLMPYRPQPSRDLV